MRKLILVSLFSFGFHSQLALAKQDIDLGLSIRELEGGKRGALAPCPDTPNCVTSYKHPGIQENNYMRPIESGDRKQAVARLKTILAKDGAEIKNETQNYLHATYTSRFFKFVDDVEFHFPTNSEIHFRSASRVGYSDLGVNKRRIERIKFKMAQGPN